MIGQAALSATGLVQPRQPGQLALSPRAAGRAGQRRGGGLRRGHQGGLPRRRLARSRTRDDAAPGLRRKIERFAQFLTLVGLAALIVGGVGVANAVAGYLEGRRDVIATLKCLGAPGGLRRRRLSHPDPGPRRCSASPWACWSARRFRSLRARCSRRRFPCRSPASIPASCSLAAAYGLLTALAFSLFPLGRAREVSPTALFRDQVAPGRTRRRGRPISSASPSSLASRLPALAIALRRRPAHRRSSSSSRRPASFVLLRLVAAGVMAAAPARAAAPLDRVPAGGRQHPPARRADAVGGAVARPRAGAAGRARPDRRQFPPRAARLRSRRRAELLLPRHPRRRRRRLRRPSSPAEAPDAKLELAPMLRGRITRCSGVPADKADVDPDVALGARGRPRHHLCGDASRRNRSSPPAPGGRRTTTARRWSPSKARSARGSRLKLGDTVTVNVLGRERRRPTIAQSPQDRLAVARRSISSWCSRPTPFAARPSATSRRWPFPAAARRQRSSPSSRGDRRLPGDHRRCGSRRRSRPVERLVGAASAGRSAAPPRSPSSPRCWCSAAPLPPAAASGIHDAVILKTLGATRGRLTRRLCPGIPACSARRRRSSAWSPARSPPGSCSTRVMDSRFRLPRRAGARRRGARRRG